MSTTVISKSDIGEDNEPSVTSPTGLNTSPLWNPYPGLENLNSVTSKYVEPIPVDPPTLRSISNPIPVSVVAPIPNLETPTTGKFSYDGSETNISGFT